MNVVGTCRVRQCPGSAAASFFFNDTPTTEIYTQVLGFEVKSSAPYGPEERWLSVVAPEEPDGVQLVLHLADEPARAFQAASRQAGRPVLSLVTDDCAGRRSG